MPVDKNWTGVYPAVTTIMKDDESVDLDATVKHLDFLIDAQTERDDWASQEFDEIDPDTMTPRDALDFIYRVKKLRS
mgnify:CR=1 FL=1